MMEVFLSIAQPFLIGSGIGFWIIFIYKKWFE